MKEQHEQNIPTMLVTEGTKIESNVCAQITSNKQTPIFYSLLILFNLLAGLCQARKDWLLIGIQRSHAEACRGPSESSACLIDSKHADKTNTMVLCILDALEHLRNCNCCGALGAIPPTPLLMRFPTPSEKFSNLCPKELGTSLTYKTTFFNMSLSKSFCSAFELHLWVSLPVLFPLWHPKIENSTWGSPPVDMKT